MAFAALVLHLVIGGSLVRAPGELPAWARHEPPALIGPSLRAEAPDQADNPACRAEFCQPRVAIPGRETRLDTRGKRTELALAAVDRLGLGPVSDAARAANAWGLRADWLPPQMDAWSAGRGGFGKLTVGFRWRLDAFHGPSWASDAP